MSKFISFEEEGRFECDRPVYRAVDRESKQILGVIFWYPDWCRYVFQPTAGTIWSARQLSDMWDFLSGNRRTVDTGSRVSPFSERNPG